MLPKSLETEREKVYTNAMFMVRVQFKADGALIEVNKEEELFKNRMKKRFLYTNPGG